MLKNIIIVLIILAILILSQQSYFERIGKNLYKAIEGQGRMLWQKCEDFWNRHILGRVTSEIEKREQIAREGLKEQMEKTTQTVWQRIKNYIFGFFGGLFNQAPAENK